MSGLGFTRSDICSISSIAPQGRIARAARGALRDDGNLLADDDRHELPASSIDHAIRLSTAAAVLAVAAVAAYVSYWHVYAVVRAHGGTGITAQLEPATIDGLVYASSMVVLYAARHRVPAPFLARWLLGAGIVATLTVNMAQGWSHGPVGAVVAAWPAVSLVGSYELLVWLVRTSGAVERGRQQSTSATVRPAILRCVLSRPQQLTSTDLAGAGATCQTQAHGPRIGAPGSLPSPQVGSVMRRCLRPAPSITQPVAAYRLRVQAGNPLSERRLAQMFGRTSRRWARARIADARQAPGEPLYTIAGLRTRRITAE